MGDRPHYFTYDDGGRDACAFKIDGTDTDCAVEAIAIAARVPFLTAWGELPRVVKADGSVGGVMGPALHRYLIKRGWRCHRVAGRFHVHDLPPGRLIVVMKRHAVAIVDNVIRSSWDPSINGEIEIAGFYSPPVARVPCPVRRVRRFGGFR